MKRVKKVGEVVFGRCLASSTLGQHLLKMFRASPTSFLAPRAHSNRSARLYLRYPEAKIKKSLSYKSPTA